MTVHDYFHFPDSCSVNNTIFKKLFYENGDLTGADKALFTEKIDKITWLYCLKPETIHIKPYKDEVREYQEIEVLEVVLAADTKVKRMAEIIMRTIPYPMVLLFRLNYKVQLWLAHQRISQKDKNKNMLEDFIATDWLAFDDRLFDRLDSRKMRFTNCFTLYSDLVDAISIYHAECITGTATAFSGEKARLFVDEIEALEEQQHSLRAALKKETQFNRKMEMNIKIKQLEMVKNKLLQGGQG